MCTFWVVELVVADVNPFNPGSGHSHRQNCVSTAHFSAVILAPCSSEHDERRLIWLLFYGDWPLCVVQKWKGWICMKITSITIVPTLNRCNGNVEAWIEPHATDQWAFSPCKTKRTEHARSQTENERFGWWPMCAERGWNTQRKKNHRK